MNSQIILADVKLTNSEKQVRDCRRRSEERCIVLIYTKKKTMLEKRNQLKNKSRFLSHSFFPFIIVIVIIILLCYHDYYNYHFVYRHRDNQYLCLHFYHVVECPNITFKNSRYIISVDGWYWHLNRDICQSQGGDLVSIETEEEWNFINNEIQRRNTSSCKNKWSIGLMKEDGN